MGRGGPAQSNILLSSYFANGFFGEVNEGTWELPFTFGQPFTLGVQEELEARFFFESTYNGGYSTVGSFEEFDDYLYAFTSDEGSGSTGGPFGIFDSAGNRLPMSSMTVLPEPASFLLFGTLAAIVIGRYISVRPSKSSEGTDHVSFANPRSSL